MVKFDVKNSARHVRGWFSSRRTWVPIAIVATTIALGATGVGVTMASTGIFTSASQPPSEISTPATMPPVAPVSTKPSAVAPPEGFDTYDGIDWGAVSASGFTGLKISFTQGHVSYLAQAVKDGDGSLTIDYFINGAWWANSSAPCSATPVGQTCGLAGGDMLDSDHGYCAAGGDVITIHVYGFGLDETQSAAIPADVMNCPAPVAPEPEPQPSTTTDSSPTSSPTP